RRRGDGGPGHGLEAARRSARTLSVQPRAAPHARAAGLPARRRRRGARLLGEPRAPGSVLDLAAVAPRAPPEDARPRGGGRGAPRAGARPASAGRLVAHGAGAPGLASGASRGGPGAVAAVAARRAGRR